MLFKDIRDQGHAIDILQRSLQGDKVSHAYLFEGPPGVGKRLAAFAMARALNCDQGGSDGCGECLNCRKIDDNVHPDVLELSLPEGKRLIPIDSVREVQKQLASRPYEGRAKVLILDPADVLSPSAANALLKTLEEPRSGSFLFLITGRASALLQTVRSRCQRIRFRPLREETVADILETSGIGPQRARVAAALSSGSVERATQFVGDEFDGRMSQALDLLEGALRRTPLSGLSVSGGLRGQRDESLAILDVLIGLLEEVLWLVGRSADADLDRPLMCHIHERVVPLLAGTSVERVASFVDAACDAALGIRHGNWNPQLAIEGMLMKMRGHTA